MPDLPPESSSVDADRGVDGRTPDTRAADHAAIDRLAVDLLPALVAKLTGTGLGEIEVREGTWKVRLRRPGESTNQGRRSTDRHTRAQPGHAGHGHAPAALEGHRAAKPAGSGHSTNGTGPATTAPAVASATTEGPASDRRRAAADQHRAVATSPAVGVFRLRSEIRPGARVQAGDRLGAVDMLGVPQEVVAPADGIVGASLVEPGEAVEYGQELVVIELPAPAPRGGA